MIQKIISVILGGFIWKAARYSNKGSSKNDPEEMNDLAGDPKYRKQLDKLFSLFKDLQKEVADPLDISKYYKNFLSSKN